MSIAMNRAMGLEAAVAAAHQDIEPNDKRGARHHGVSRSTHNRWRRGEPLSPLYRAGDYLLRCRDPWRAWTALQVSMRWGRVKWQKTPELVERWRTLNGQRASAQAEEAVLLDELALEQVMPQELSNVRERIAAAVIELSAIGRELGARGVNPQTYRER